MSKFVPLRNFIFDRLYHPSEGYFCKKGNPSKSIDFQVGELIAPINFKKLIGYDDYQKELVSKYPTNAWLTPCEIFKPYYGMTIGNYIRNAHEEYEKYGKITKYEKIRIVEAGAGTGSAAESILYYFKNFHQQLLQNIEYTIVEISPTLCSRIETKLSKSYPHLLKNNQIKIINDDISTYKNPNLCYTLFFQVLDNLPHDKVIWNQSLKTYDKFVSVHMENLIQTQVQIQKDPLISQCLSLYTKMSLEKTKINGNILDKIAHYVVQRMTKKNKINNKDLFLPTFFYQLMKNIKKNIPNNHLVISDFDFLATSVPGINAPIVSRKGLKSSDKKDYDTYLVQRGEADIFFPIDFNFLQLIYKEIMNNGSTVVKSYEFINEFAQNEWAQTQSLFNPIKEDFANTSFFVSNIESK